MTTDEDQPEMMLPTVTIEEPDCRSMRFRMTGTTPLPERAATRLSLELDEEWRRDNRPLRPGQLIYIGSKPLPGCDFEPVLDLYTGFLTVLDGSVGEGYLDLYDRAIYMGIGPMRFRATFEDAFLVRPRQIHMRANGTTILRNWAEAYLHLRGPGCGSRYVFADEGRITIQCGADDLGLREPGFEDFVRPSNFDWQHAEFRKAARRLDM